MTWVRQNFIEIWCDNDDCPAPVNGASYSNEYRVLKDAREHGWTIKRDSDQTTICPTCTRIKKEATDDSD